MQADALHEEFLVVFTQSKRLDATRALSYLYMSPFASWRPAFVPGARSTLARYSLAFAPRMARDFASSFLDIALTMSRLSGGSV